MSADERMSRGYFPIARESADIPFDRFYRQYYEAERPVIIEGVSTDWPARHKWTADYLHRALSDEPTATASTLWYWLDRGALEDDYDTPAFIEKIYQLGDVFPRSQNLRIWLHPRGNVSPWHYDTNFVNVFNVQVTGRKEWTLLAPDTPPGCYPFSFYGVVDGRGDDLLRGRSHTRFTLEEGDMIFVPPCWFHNVVSSGDENISLNWIMTKTATSVRSVAMERELEIYAIQHYFMKHRSELVRKLFDRFYFAIPGFLRYRWRYDSLIETPYAPRRIDLWMRVLKELAALGPTLVHSGKAYATVRGIRAVRRLESTGS